MNRKILTFTHIIFASLRDAAGQGLWEEPPDNERAGCRALARRARRRESEQLTLGVASASEQRPCPAASLYVHVKMWVNNQKNNLEKLYLIWYNFFMDMKKRDNPTRKFIRKSRRTARLTQTALASKAGVGLRFIRDLEQGKASLRMDTVNKVLKLFGKCLGPINLSKEIS